MSFSLLYSDKRKLIGKIASTSPLKKELFYLNRAIRKTDNYIDRIFGTRVICCHFCAYPELHDLIQKQQKRNKRKAELEKKLHDT